MELIRRTARCGRRQVQHRLVGDGLIQTLDDHRFTTGRLLELGEAITTQKPMKSTSTNTVLDATP